MSKKEPPTIELSPDVSKEPLAALEMVSESTTVLPAKWQEMSIDERIKDAQARLIERSGTVVEAALCFAEIDPTMDGPPDEWVQQLGKEAAEKKFRVARAAWTPTKSAPAGISVAQAILLGVMKSRSQEVAAAAPPTSNVQIVVNMPQFEEIEVE